MTIDKQVHKDILIALIEQSQIPGNSLEIVYELLIAIKSAEIVS